MRRSLFMAFDDFISSSTAVSTSQDLNAALGRFDTLAWHAIVDNVSPAATLGQLNVWIEHSGDDRTFQPKAIHGTGGGGLPNAEMQLTVPTIGFAQGWAYDSNVFSSTQMPSLAYVRLKLQLVTITSAHVRLWVTARDRGHALQSMKLSFGRHA
jgi:hypothetical protein